MLAVLELSVVPDITNERVAATGYVALTVPGP